MKILFLSSFSIKAIEIKKFSGDIAPIIDAQVRKNDENIKQRQLLSCLMCNY